MDVKVTILVLIPAIMLYKYDEWLIAMSLQSNDELQIPQRCSHLYRFVAVC